MKGLSDQYIKVDANKATLDGYIKQSDADLASLAEKTHAAQRSAEASEKYAELVATHHALKMELPWTYVVQKKKVSLSLHAVIARLTPQECAAAEVAVREAEEKAEDIAAHVLRVEVRLPHLTTVFETECVRKKSVLTVNKSPRWRSTWRNLTRLDVR